MLGMSRTLTREGDDKLGCEQDGAENYGGIAGIDLYGKINRMGKM